MSAAAAAQAPAPAPTSHGKSRHLPTRLGLLLARHIAIRTPDTSAALVFLIPRGWVVGPSCRLHALFVPHCSKKIAI
uniref:Uncharacterized protein n=1 Tax=Arundo donax TaxID=35708 RepID=A0A0A9D333_ARUDO